MKLEALHIGMKVNHPQYGLGVVKTISEHAAEIRFDDGQRTVAPESAGLQPAEAQAALNGLEMPLAQLIDQTVSAMVKQLGLELPDVVVSQLGARWLRGRLVMHPADAALQPKEVPLETFFHKIVMVRNNLRVLEQKVNSHPQLNDADRVELQQYISRCYGSLTTFNVFFRDRADQFVSSSE
jgi:hypothetical protein